MGVASTLKEFRAFALKANAIDLAIGFVLGAAFTAVVTSMVSGLITPLIAAIFGQANFASAHFTINHSEFNYGLVVNAIISLLAVAATLFFLVIKPIAMVKTRLGHVEASPTVAPCPACLSLIPLGAKRCAACTEVLADDWATS